MSAIIVLNKTNMVYRMTYVNLYNKLRYDSGIKILN